MLIHWGLAFLALSILITWQCSKVVPRIYVVTLFYLLCLANAIICFRILGFNLAEEALRDNPLTRAPTFLLSTSCFSAFTILLFAMGAFMVSEIDPESILRNGLYLYGVIGSLLSIIDINIIPHASSNATIIALALPYFIPSEKKQWAKILLVIPAFFVIIRSNTSSPVGVSCVIVASYLWMTGRKKFILIGALPLLVAIYDYGIKKVFDDTDRFKAYKAFFSYWWNDSPWNVVFGYGPGSFEILSQIIQEKIKFMVRYDEYGFLKGSLWMHMHSDLIQYVWEYGAIGGLLLFLCAVRLFLDLKGNAEARAIMIGCMSAMLIDFPVRYPGVPIVLLLLFGVTMSGRNLQARRRLSYNAGYGEEKRWQA